VVYFSDDASVEAKAKEETQELSGQLAPSQEQDKLMRSVMEGDKQKIDDGRLLSDATNRNIGSFVPDTMYAQLTKNYRLAEQLYGERILQLLTGYQSNTLERNIRIPEFHHELVKRLEQNVERLKDEGFLDKDGMITEHGTNLASFVMYMEELERLLPYGLTGEVQHKKKSHHGEQQETTPWKRGSRYRDLDIRKTITTAIKRGRRELTTHDLYLAKKHSKGTAYIIFGMDASASMKGKKIEMAKKAGIALAFKAHTRRDRVGLVIFGEDIKDAIPPTNDFSQLLMKIGRAQTANQTEFVSMLQKAVELFPPGQYVKHLIILSDALPTKGAKPEQETLEAVAVAKSMGITISVVGINLDKDGAALARKMAEQGDGRVIAVNDIDMIDKAVLEDYDATVG